MSCLPIHFIFHYRFVHSYKIRVLLTNALGALFKDSVLRNYSLEKLNSSIYNVLNTQTFIKTYHLRFLKSALEPLVSISHKIINVYIYTK
jgi:hypothetical protein